MGSSPASARILQGWTKPIKLATGYDVALATTPSGAVAAAWVNGHAHPFVSAVAGSAKMGFGQPVNLGPGRDPQVGVADDGTAYVVWAQEKMGTLLTDTFVAIRRPGGAFAPGVPVGEALARKLIVGRGGLAIVASISLTGELALSSSTRGGAFGPFIRPAGMPTPVPNEGSQFDGLAVSPTGEITVVYLVGFSVGSVSGFGPMIPNSQGFPLIRQMAYDGRGDVIAAADMRLGPAYGGGTARRHSIASVFRPAGGAFEAIKGRLRAADAAAMFASLATNATNRSVIGWDSQYAMTVSRGLGGAVGPPIAVFRDRAGASIDTRPNAVGIDLKGNVIAAKSAVIRPRRRRCMSRCCPSTQRRRAVRSCCGRTDSESIPVSP